MAGPTYEVSNHDLLSEEVTDSLSPSEFDAHAALAEDLLNLDGTSLTGRNKEKARRAIALQINHQFSVPDEVAYARAERDAAGQSIRYRAADASAVDNAAARLADEVTGDKDPAEVGSRHTRTKVRTIHPAPSEV